MASYEVDESPPRFYMKDMVSILKERNELKERVLELEEEVMTLRADVVRLSNFGTLTLSPRTVLLQRDRADVEEPAGDGRSAVAAVFQKPLKCYKENDEYQCITDVEVTGYEKKRRNYVYIIKLTWSDGQRFEIYRRYGEFFTLQNTLLQIFPEGGKGNERIIPILPTTDNVLSLFGRTNTESVIKARLSTINEYCQILLLHLDKRILKMSCLLNFFKPTIGDKQLSRLKRNSISDMDLSTLSIYPQNIPAGSLFEEYLVLADYRGTTESELTVNAGERVKVIKKEDNGWWLVVKEDEHLTCPTSKEEVGYISSEYLKPHKDHELEMLAPSIQDVADQRQVTCHTSSAHDGVTEELKYVAMEDYSTNDPWQLCFYEKEVILVLEKSEDGWWLAVRDKKQGWVPGSYLRPFGEEVETEKCKEDHITSKEGVPIFSEATSIDKTQRGEEYVVITGYSGEEKEDISFPKGAIVEVLDKCTSGWWMVRYKGINGVAPASFLAIPSNSPLPDRTFSFWGENSMDIGHCISGIKVPPPRSKAFLRHTQRKMSRDHCSSPCQRVVASSSGDVPDLEKSYRNEGGQVPVAYVDNMARRENIRHCSVTSRGNLFRSKLQ